MGEFGAGGFPIQGCCKYIEEDRINADPARRIYFLLVSAAASTALIHWPFRR
jgi:hypothetical protein